MRSFFTLILMLFSLPTFGFNICPQLFIGQDKLNITSATSEFKDKLDSFISTAPGKWIPFGKELLHYQKLESRSTEGRGALVFIPGLGSDGLQIKSQSSFFNEYRNQGYDIYVLELPGQGFTLAARNILSSRPTVEYRTDYLVESIEVFLREVVLQEQAKNIEIMGHSFGGQVVSAFLSQSPYSAKMTRATLMMSGVVTLDRLAYAHLSEAEISMAHSLLKGSLSTMNHIPRSGIGFIDRNFHPTDNFFAKGVQQMKELFPHYEKDDLKVYSMLGLTLGSTEQNTITNISGLRRDLPITVVVGEKEHLVPMDSQFELGQQAQQQTRGKLILAKSTGHNFFESPYREELGKSVFNSRLRYKGYYSYDPITNSTQKTTEGVLKDQSLRHSMDWFADPEGIYTKSFLSSTGSIFDFMFSTLKPTPLPNYSSYLKAIGDQSRIQHLEEFEQP